MFVWKRALPLCLFFLCAAGEATRGHCVDKKCWALFLESKNFTEAQSWCRVKDGQLYNVDLWKSLPELPLPHGHFWIKRTVREAGAKPEQCWSAVVAPEQVQFQNSTCTDKLDGFMCQYSATSTCGALPPSESAHVNYTTAWGFQVKAVFPAGTVAVAHTPGRAPNSKHICTGTDWMRAPWSCEVMSGGCEHACDASKSTPACTCPAGQSLHHNSFTCTEDPCAKCAPECVKEGGECRCREGFRLGSGGRCVDVDECSEDRTLCSGPGQECENLEGSYNCTCQEDYDMVGEVCVDMSLCFVCEHRCDFVQGVLTCVCGTGYSVDPQDPTKCEEHCSEQDCPAKCVSQDQCYCPTGYIQDQRDGKTVCTDIDECMEEAQCEHHCVNTFGGFRCECDEGFRLLDGHKCVPIKPSQVMGPVYPTASPSHPTAVPSYVKTGSILGITVFAMLSAALLYFLLHSLIQYCTKVQFYSLKHDMDIFTLQQVSTETYKKLSYDWQFRSDCHRL